MSVRIGIYDFFSYTLPGVFYLLIIAYGLFVFGFIKIDPNALSGFSFYSFLILIGAGYIAGSLLDPIAYRWSLFFQSRPRVARKFAFDEFHKLHPQIELNFKPEDWRILLYTLKHSSIEAATEIELHSVAGVMLRNISFGLALISTIYLLFFFVVNNNLWNLVLAGISFYFSTVAIKRGRLRRHWFYLSIFEAFVAYYLVQEKSISHKELVMYRNNENETQKFEVSKSISDNEVNFVKSNPLSSEVEQQADL